MATRSTTADIVDNVRSTLRTNPFEALLWLLPAGVVLFLYTVQRVSLVSVTMLCAGLLGAGLVVLAARHPAAALTVLVVVIPFQTVLLATMYRYGTPASVLRPLSSWKELAASGIIAAAIRTRARRQRPLDRIDLLGLAYVAAIGMYALLPRFFVGDAPLDSAVRANGFRFNAGFVLLFLAARHLDMSQREHARLLRAALVTATVVAALGLVEFVDPAWWNEMAVYRIQVTKYLVDVVHSTPPNYLNVLTYTPFAGTTVLRIGSVFLSPLNLGFFLIAGYAIACERVVMDRARGLTVVALGVLASAVVLTQTRSAIIAMIVATLLAFRPREGRAGVGRARFAAVVALLVVVAVPLAVSSGLSERVGATAAGQEQGSQSHVNSLHEAISTVAAHPLGTGLGTSGSTALRYEVANTTITENFYLQVGVEAGVMALVLFTAVTVVVVRRLGRVANRSTEADVHAIHGALVGLAIAALFLHVWQELAVSWTVWGLAGVALAVERGHLIADSSQLSNRAPMLLLR